VVTTKPPAIRNDSWKLKDALLASAIIQTLAGLTLSQAP